MSERWILLLERWILLLERWIRCILWVDSNTAYEAALDIHPLSTVFLLPLSVLRLLVEIVHVPFIFANDDFETLVLTFFIFRFQEHLYLGLNGLPTAKLAKLPAGGPHRCCRHGWLKRNSTRDLQLQCRATMATGKVWMLCGVACLFCVLAFGVGRLTRSLMWSCLFLFKRDEASGQYNAQPTRAFKRVNIYA